MIQKSLQNSRIVVGAAVTFTSVLVLLLALNRDVFFGSDGETGEVKVTYTLVSVALTNQPRPTNTPSPTPTATPTPSPSPTPSPTSTRTPTATATRTPRPTRTPTDTPTPPPLDCLDSVYLADVTVPDYSHMEKGEDFVKTWQVRNSGECDWPEDTHLVFVSDEQMSASETITVGALAAEETIEISVAMTTPDDDGEFQGVWRLADGSGEFFGTLLTVIIRVGEVAAMPDTAAAAAPPPPVVGGHIGGGFELGGQTHTLEHPNEMHHAGMTWVKFQHKWSSGQNPNEVAGRVQVAHANGLKVLLSIPGGNEYPDHIDFAGYVEFLRGVAALGPDGIEVWNEQNIDREWPAGTIDPAAYVHNVLIPAYNAIKSVNPNILVISGAPAPTGFFGGCGGAGCDDAPYIAGMLAAGAASYVDCIGIHYNEGILPPSQTSGDPRGNSGHYTRYFWGMLGTYWNNFGGARPLCFTEIGYVSPEGYGPLPPHFGWGAGTTVAEQAAWLAEAAVLASNSGKVRLMIVYNVDFTHYDEHDPQAGYAIIRPNGGCPACETLHNVTH